ncbi:hypothetical protein ACIOEX_05240 [Streptomyces sp. NPDC087850]|uniref:hypothetical protein n=1 Tax=Streptomyces sp. NPDC087850 TaxID=3365809 RepID=UPI0038257203
MSSRRRIAAAVPATVAALALALSACGGEGGLSSAGPTPTAIGPVELWPDLPAISSPPLGLDASSRERVPGVEVAPGRIGTLDPVTVVRAETAASPEDASGIDGLPRQTAARLASCDGTPVGPAGPTGPTVPAAPSDCPVLRAYHHDLTGDGRDELIVAVRLPYQRLAVRCYTAEKGGLTRIMSTSDRVIGAELAGRGLILRVASAGIPGYEYRTTWSWDRRRGTMIPTRGEIAPDTTRTPWPAPTGLLP